MILSSIKQELSVLIWLFRARKKGQDVLSSAVEMVYDIVNMCFIVLDRELCRKMVKAEMIALLYDISIGKIKTDNKKKFSTYLVNRYLRLTRNLLRLGIVKTNDDMIVHLGSITNADGKDWSDIYIYHFLSEKAEKGNSKEHRKGYMRERTLQKEQKIARIAEFYPGCLKDVENHQKLVQNSLF